MQMRRSISWEKCSPQEERQIPMTKGSYLMERMGSDFSSLNSVARAQLALRHRFQPQPRPFYSLPVAILGHHSLTSELLTVFFLGHVRSISVADRANAPKLGHTAWGIAMESERQRGGGKGKLGTMTPKLGLTWNHVRPHSVRCGKGPRDSGLPPSNPVTDRSVIRT